MPRRIIGFIRRAKVPKGSSKSFHHRYTAMEIRRADLIERLTKLGEGAQRHPAYNTARALLNKTFRKESLARRASILQAAAWLIDVMEHITMGL
jgi:hypothetical protein